MKTLGLVLVALALGCGDDDGSSDAGTDAPTIDAPVTDAPTADTISDAPTERVIELAGGDWRINAASEGYVCALKTMEETVFIREFRPVAPQGTHHTVVTVRPGGDADGVFPCDAFTNAAQMIYGSGVGTDNFTLPDGVAIRVEAGQQVLLNLHLFNTGGEALEGYSAIEAVLMDEADVEHEAQVVLAGEESFSIPARAMDYDVDGRCTMSGDTNVFAVMPHMHTFGRFMRVTGTPSGGDPVVLHEAFYSFDDQRYTTFDTLSLSAGDQIDVNCRYDNPSDTDVPYGDSTLSEMCYAVLYRYPAVPSDDITCTR